MGFCYYRLMKKYLLLLLSFFLLFVFPSSLFAQEEMETTYIGSDEIFVGNQFKAGENVVFSGVVDGDLFLAGGKVTFDGQTTGDLFVGAGQVTIRGEVGQNLRVGGGQVLIDGPVGRNVLVMGGNVELSDRAVIGGSLISTSGNLENQAQVALGGHLLGGRVYQNGFLGGDLMVRTDSQFELGEEALVGGDLEYWAPNSLSLTEEQVRGEVAYQPTEKKEMKKTSKEWLDSNLDFKRKFALGLPFKLSWLVGALVLGWLILKLFPQTFKVVEHLEGNPLSCFGWGLFSYFSLPVLIFVLLITLIGIFLIPLWGMVFGLLFLLGKIFGALTIGHLLIAEFFKKERRGWALFLGLVVGMILSYLPVVGVLYAFVLNTAALGALSYTLVQALRPAPSQKALFEKKVVSE